MKSKLTTALFIILIVLGFIIAPPVLYIMGIFGNEIAIGYILIMMSLRNFNKLLSNIGDGIKNKINKYGKV